MVESGRGHTVDHLDLPGRRVVNDGVLLVV